jgi:zinc transport system ATP-binding protein
VEQVVQMKNVTAGYGNIVALDNVSLSIPAGSFTGIIGPNGGGKTTLVKLILGLIEPWSGEVKVWNQKPQSIRSKIGYVPQMVHINRQFPISVRQVVLQGCLADKPLFFHQYSAIDKEKVEWSLDRLNISDLAERQIAQLSGGQWQRVLIARALVVDPVLLILDEPTNGLDSSASSKVYELLQELNRKMTIVMVTHDTMAIGSCVGDIACINHQLYYHGVPDLNPDMVMQLYGCPVELIAHGMPHRVLGEHGGHIND